MGVVVLSVVLLPGSVGGPKSPPVTPGDPDIMPRFPIDGSCRD